jgi:hypothetical protein
MSALARDHKFIDTDVRADPSLRRLAGAYLRDYAGGFEFLVDAKVAAMQGQLSVQTVRGVLNCMLADPKILVSGPDLPAARSVLRRVELQRPARVQLKARFKLPVLSSKWPSAYLAHYLDPRHTELWWFPHIEKYEWYPRVWCGAQISRRQMLNTAGVPEGKTPCRRCLAQMEESPCH